MEVILKTLSGSYVGEGGTINGSRDYAKRFASEEEARDYAKENRMHAEFVAEPYSVPGYGFGGSLETVG